MFESFLELVPKNTIDDEVGRSIGDKSEIAEAGKTKEPGGGDELVTTPDDRKDLIRREIFESRPDDLIQHEELKAVQDNPGDVTDKEDGDNAYEDGGHVHLIPGLGLLCMTVPAM